MSAVNVKLASSMEYQSEFAGSSSLAFEKLGPLARTTEMAIKVGKRDAIEI